MDALNNEKWTALHLVSTFGNLEAVKILLAHKADANARTTDGLFPLFMAAKAGHKDIAAGIAGGRGQSRRSNWATPE